MPPLQIDKPKGGPVGERGASPTIGGAPPGSDAALGSRLVKNSKWNIAGWVCLLLLGFVSSPIMVHRLGHEHYGLMALLISMITPLGLMDIGIGEATIKYVSESLGRNDMPEASLYLRSTLLLNLLVGFAGALLLSLLAPLLVGSVFNIAPESAGLARSGLVMIGVMWAATQVRQTFVGAITALQNYKVVSVGTFLTQFVNTASGLAVLLAGGGLLAMLRVQAFMAVVSTLVWLMAARRLLPEIVMIPSYRPDIFRRTVRFGFWQMLNNLFGLLTHQSQRWWLGAKFPVSAVGFYNIPVQLVSMIYSAVYRVGQVSFPAVSHLHGQGREDHAARLIVQTSWMLTLMATSAYATLAIFAGDLLRLWIGADFAVHGTRPLQILTVGFSMSCLFAIPNFYLLGTGRTRWLAASAAGQTMVTLITAFFAVPRWGVAGAAAALVSGMVSAYGATLTIMWIRLFRGVIRGPVYFSATFGPLIVCAVFGAGLNQMYHLIGGEVGWPALLVGGGGCAVILGAISLTVDRYFLPGGRERLRALIILLPKSLIKIIKRVRQIAAH